MNTIIAKINYDNSEAFVLSKEPKLIYTEYDSRLLIGVDKTKTFYNTLYYENNRFAKAFGGREFHLPLSNGNTMICKDTWWYGGVQCAEKLLGITLVPVTCEAYETLKRCFVFAAWYVDADKWAKLTKPSKLYTYKEYEAKCERAWWKDLEINKTVRQQNVR